jgi:mannosyltransferase
MSQNGQSSSEVIVPNLNKRFSGITSTVSQVVPEQSKELEFASVGYPLPFKIKRMGWRELIRICQRPLTDGRWRIYHARRNIEMIAGLILRRVFNCKIHLVFTSTAQREHTWLTKFLYRRMDTLLTTSPRAARFLKRDPDYTIPHGIDTRTYQPAPDKKQAWADGGLPGQHGVGIFGRVRPQKGHREFIDALCEVLPKHPQFTAVVIGQVTPKFEPFVEELKKKLSDHGIADRVAWLGKLPFEDIPVWFSRMSLVVCASHNEGFGLTCLEAMASEVPVVATRAGAWELIIENEKDGYIVPCEDATAMAGALDKAMSEPRELAGMGQRAREKVQSGFTVEIEAASLNRAYKEIWKQR